MTPLEVQLYMTKSH